MNFVNFKAISTRVLLASAVGAAALTAAMPAAAQQAAAEPAATTDQASSTDADIVVTARKREESIINAPVAISAFGGETLKALNTRNLEDVGKYVPNLTISRYGVGNTAQAAIFIRAIGLQDHLITTDPGVGVYLDGVYLGRQLGSNLSLTNIERIEVLRGPQGTLYGRNTLGGAVNIITRKPGSDEGAEITAQVGSRGRINGSFFGDTRLSPTLAVSLSGSYERRNGVGTAVNIPNPSASIGEQNDASGRAAAYWTPTDAFSILASVDFVRARDGQSPYKVDIYDPTALDPALQVRPDDSGTSVPGLETTSLDLFGASVTGEYKLNDQLTTKLLTSYRQTKYTGGLADTDDTSLQSVFPEKGDAEQASVELQLNGEFGRFNFVSGLYYFYENGSNRSQPAFFFGGNSDYYIQQRTNSYAVYANGNFDITDKLTVGGGVRYSNDDKRATAQFSSFPGPVTRNANYDAVTAQGNINYKLGKDATVYGTIQLGYQPGSFTPRPFGGPSSFNASPKTTATNYEIGFKGRVTPNWIVLLSAFNTEYSDRGLPYSFINANGFNTVIISADARARGFEAESTLTLGGFKLKGSFGYLDSKITSINSPPPAGQPATVIPTAGSPTALSPEFTGSGTVAYTYKLHGGGAITGQWDYSYRGSQFGQPVARASEIIGARGLLGFNLKYENSKRDFSFSVYGSNILNKVYDQGRLDQVGFVGVVRSNDRSEFGVRVTKKFGA